MLSLNKHRSLEDLPKTCLHGTRVAMYSVGQERRLVDPPSQVVAGVRTVTTNMDGRDALPRMSRPFAFCCNQSVVREGPLVARGNISSDFSAAAAPACPCFV